MPKDGNGLWWGQFSSQIIEVSSIFNLADTWSNQLMPSQLKDPAKLGATGIDKFDDTASTFELQRWEDLIEIALQKGVALSVEKMLSIKGKLLAQSS